MAICGLLKIAQIFVTLNLAPFYQKSFTDEPTTMLLEAARMDLPIGINPLDLDAEVRWNRWEYKDIGSGSSQASLFLVAVWCMSGTAHR